MQLLLPPTRWEQTLIYAALPAVHGAQRVLHANVCGLVALPYLLVMFNEGNAELKANQFSDIIKCADLAVSQGLIHWEMGGE